MAELINDVVDADAAASYLLLHPNTVRRLAAEGKLPGVKIGRVWRFRQSLLEDFMNGGVCSASAMRSHTETIQ